MPSAAIPASLILDRGMDRRRERRLASYALLMEATERVRMSSEEREVLDRWIERIRTELDIESVWLFGSRARGDAGEHSDVDLLLITRGNPEHDRERAWALIDEVARERGADPTVYVPHTWDRAWLENRREIGSFFTQELDRDKVVLFGEP